MTTGRRIGEMAEKKNMSLMQVAKAAGIPYNTLYSIVKRKSDNIAYDKIVKIAAALGISEFELITGHPDTEIEKEMEQFLQMRKKKNLEKWLAEFAMQHPLFMQALKNEGITIDIDNDSFTATRNGLTTWIDDEELERLLKRTLNNFRHNIKEYLDISIEEE